MKPDQLEAEFFNPDVGTHRKRTIMNKSTHPFTCLPATPALVAEGLTHMVCLTDTPERKVGAFHDSASASAYCDQMNNPPEVKTSSPILGTPAHKPPEDKPPAHKPPEDKPPAHKPPVK